MSDVTRQRRHDDGRAGGEARHSTPDVGNGSTRKPPVQRYLRWCPKCDRTDRVTDLKDRHSTGGKRCDDELVVLTYRLVEE